MFILEINPLVLPDIGLVFWNTIAFVVLLVILGKFAWKPMLKAIADRENGIEEALLRADKMKAEIATMQNENEALLAKAREERATLIKEAKAFNKDYPPNYTEITPKDIYADTSYAPRDPRAKAEILYKLICRWLA